jgi:hypothetical protein
LTGQSPLQALEPMEEEEEEVFENLKYIVYY